MKKKEFILLSMAVIYIILLESKLISSIEISINVVTLHIHNSPIITILVVVSSLIRLHYIFSNILNKDNYYKNNDSLYNTKINRFFEMIFDIKIYKYYSIFAFNIFFTYYSVIKIVSLINAGSISKMDNNLIYILIPLVNAVLILFYIIYEGRKGTKKKEEVKNMSVTN